MAAFLPADLVSEILLWLPVEPLLRFRLVSKIWCSLIDSDDFMKLHLHRSSDTKRNRKIICRRFGTDLIDTINLDSLVDAGKLKYPLVTNQCDGLVSCNGLLLSWTYWYENKADSHEYKVDIAISNPSTGKYHIVAPSQEDYYSCGLGLLCFGYDAVNDDFKVVNFNRINHLRISTLTWDAQVYSLKSNSWRTIKDFPYEICWSRLTNGVLAHGALHFVVATYYGKEDHFGSNSVAAFDLATEKTRLVSLPDFGVGNNVVYELVELEGCLCIVAYEKIVSSARNFLGVWVVKDYGVGESWNKLLSAAQLSFMGQIYSVVPVAYSKNGCEVLLQQDFKEFIWFDLENNAVRKVKIRRFSRCFEAQVFVQSLVPLGYGAKTIPEKRVNNKKKRKKIGMKR